MLVVRVLRLGEYNKVMRVTIITLLVCLMNIQVAHSENQTALISKISGVAETRVGNELAWKEAKVGQSLTTRDKIRTKMGSYVKLVLPDKSTIELKENSVLDLSRMTSSPDDGSEVTKIKLWIGTVRCDVEKLKNENSSFEIHTPVAVCGVRGTIPGVQTDGNNATFWSEENDIDVWNPKTGDKTSVGAGERVDVDENGNLGDVNKLTDNDSNLTGGWDEKADDKTSPEIQHSGLQNTNPGEDVAIGATVTDDVKVEYAKLYYKVPSKGAYVGVDMSGHNNSYNAIIPGAEISKPELLYYIEASDGTNKSRTRTYAVQVSDAGEEMKACDNQDNDGDGQIDEETENGVDDDADGRTDEDLNCNAATSLNAPTISMPLAGEKFCEASIDLKGSVEGDLPLTVLVSLNGTNSSQEELTDVKTFSLKADLADGKNEISVTVKDSNDNMSPSKIIEVYAYLTKPTAPELSVVRKGGTKIRVEGKATPSTTLILKLNGSEVARQGLGDAGEFEIDDLDVIIGQNVITAYTENYCQQKGDETSKEVTINEESPFSITSPVDMDCLSGEPIKVSTDIDPSRLTGGKYLVAVVNGEEQGDVNAVSLNPGNNVIEVVERTEGDENSRMSSSNSVKVIYDPSMPEMNIDNPPDGLLVGQNCGVDLAVVSGYVSDQESGIDEVVITAGKSQTLQFGGSKEVELGVDLLSLLNDGENQVTVTAKNSCGNSYTMTPPRTVTLDRTPPTVTIGTINYTTIGPTIIVKEAPVQTPVVLSGCPGNVAIRLSVTFPDLVADVPVSVMDNRSITGKNDYCNLISMIHYNVIDQEGEMSMPPTTSEIKNISITQSGGVEVYAYDDAGNRSEIATKPITAEKKVTINGLVLLESSPGIFEGKITAAGNSVLEIEAYWLVNGVKYGSYIDQSITVQCSDVPPAPPF